MGIKETRLLPVDLLFPERRESMASGKCLPPPIGCGKQLGPFRDELSRKEYTISGLCQVCQDEVFGSEEDQ